MDLQYNERFINIGHFILIKNVSQVQAQNSLGPNYLNCRMSLQVERRQREGVESLCAILKTFPASRTQTFV